MKQITKLLVIFAIALCVVTPQRSSAYMGVADVVIDPTNLVQNTTSAIANPVTAAMTTLEKVKTYALDPIAWAVAKRIIQGLTNQTVNWINSGFKGNPAYVTDPNRFFLDVADKQASQILSESGLSNLCTPFRAEVRLALVKNYLSTSDSQSYSCTLSAIKDNFDQFTNDFSQGGWEGWFEMTQNELNNPYGSYLNTQNRLALQIGNQQAIYQKQLDWGSGILSFEKCKAGSEVTETMLKDSGPMDDSNPYAGYKVGDCLNNNKETVTPGSVIQGQLENVLGSGVRQLELADSFNEIVSALVTQLTKRVVGGLGNGLRGASNTVPAPLPTNPSAPTIYLQGETPMEVFVNDKFRDPGAVAVDSKDGDITSKIQVSSSPTFDKDTIGQYVFTYTVTNSKGIAAVPVTRIVNVCPKPQQGTATGTGSGPCGEDPTQSQTVCTQLGTDEQNYMLPLLNGGTAPDQVATMTNQNFNLGYGAQAVYYPSNNTIGLPEFYAAGPTTGRPVSPSTGLPWDIVVRCTNSTGGGTGYPPPADAATKHGNHTADVAAAKQSVINDGIAFDSDCNIFEITRRAANAIGAGVLWKGGGRNCNGYAVDIIAWPDGYIYDVLIGSDVGGAIQPTWDPTGCPNGSTCPNDYRPAP